MSISSVNGAAPAKTGRILICDDERNIVRLIQVHMERQGHSVTTAYDGRDVLELLKTDEFDLLVLDVMMPGMDGFEVLSTLRQDPKTAELPVIMLTAKSQDEDIFKGYHLGAHMYLTKPVDLGELVTFVRTLIA